MIYNIFQNHFACIYNILTQSICFVQVWPKQVLLEITVCKQLYFYMFFNITMCIGHNFWGVWRVICQIAEDLKTNFRHKCVMKIAGAVFL